MAIDFSKLTTTNSIDTIINPRDLFNVLPHKIQKYQYPRDVQSQVWKEWFSKRDNNTNIIKMNTGSGKTVVGLIILKSSLNEQKGPAVYVVPDNFLIEQLVKEANELGIKVTQNIDSLNFLRGKEILVCNIHKLVNGKSKFGINEKKIEIGTIIIDDAHACLDTVQSQFSINIPNTLELYSKLLKIFLSSIKQQSESKAIELENNQPNSIAMVPFWTWKKNISQILQLLQENSQISELIFSYPLLKEYLLQCRCVISSNSVEITPHMIPLDQIVSLQQAKRKIFMTATLVDDSILSTHFNIDKSYLSNVITPETAGDIGDRLIMIPQAINPSISDIELKSYYKDLSRVHNVVVIVPSEHRLNTFWKDASDLVVTKEDIHIQVEKLKNSHIGLVILINRYDGIDLPYDACRVLVIDGLPDSRRQIDQITQSQLLGSKQLLNHKIQKIEQGMGRGVRSNDDYCIVFLMGKSLVSDLYSSDAIDKFSNATKTQFKLSENLSEQLKTIQDVNDALQYFLARDEGWLSASKGGLASLTYEFTQPDLFAIVQREAYNDALIGQYNSAIKLLNDYLPSIDDEILLGYAKQILAEYQNYTDEIESQKLLLSALRNNRNLVKPIDGISYEKINHATTQANAIQLFLNKTYSNNLNKLIIDVQAILNNLVFLPNTSNKFEEAIKNIGILLGFYAQRPEAEFGRGSDNIWAVGDNSYFIIECKNGTTNSTINKHDINQLTGSISWFEHEYKQLSSYIPIMIHLGNTCEHSATPHKEARVMTHKHLEMFNSNIFNFFVALKDKLNSLDEIKKLLVQYHLRSIDIVEKYTTEIKIKK